MKTLIVVTGPTAVGKTAVSLDLAQHFDIPIINADSRQVYRDMPICTAAPTAEEQQRVKHYFVGTLALDQYYSAAMYEQQVLTLLPQLFATSDYALLSGGSMMYIDAVCDGIDDIPTVDDDTRQTLKRRLAEEGLDSLCEQLRQLDPEHYETVDRKNPRRVVHALEICLMTGRTYTSFRKKERLGIANPRQQGNRRPFRIVKTALTLPREEIYDRINRRVDKMVGQGLVEEARRLLPMRDMNSLNTVGFKELFAYFDGKWTLAEAVERIKGNTRRYARKQLTWFKRDPDVKWFAPTEQQQIIDYILSCG